MEGALEMEYTKGEGSGIYQALGMLELLIEAHEYELSTRNIEENEEEA